MSPAIALRIATTDDAPLLAAMNRQLIEDEGSRNPMTLAQLIERMRGWLAKHWQALIVLVDGEPVGYTLYQLRRDEYFPEQQRVYMRQFFIAREMRGHGIGAAAFERVTDEYFPAGATLTLEVLSTNPRGMEFWQKVGFAPYSVEMRRTNYAEKPME